MPTLSSSKVSWWMSSMRSTPRPSWMSQPMCSLGAEDAAQVGDVLLALGGAGTELHQRLGEGERPRDVARELEHSGPHARRAYPSRRSGLEGARDDDAHGSGRRRASQRCPWSSRRIAAHTCSMRSSTGLAAQDLDDSFEVIVVDDASGDDTRDGARAGGHAKRRSS